VIAHWDEVEAKRADKGPLGFDSYDLGSAARTVSVGVSRARVSPGKQSSPVHVEVDEEEIFVGLDGDGALELTASPVAREDGVADEAHPVRAGHVVSRPPGTRLAHAFRAGEAGLTLLAYGTRDPNDIAYYPRSNKIYFRDVGLIARLDHLSYEAGEESPY
jgi:uncharacterized cupin superfamily protein